MAAVNAKALFAVRSVVRATNRAPTMRAPSPAEYHNVQVSSTPRVPIGMLWNVEGNGQQDTLHMTSDNFIANPLQRGTFYNNTVTQGWKDGGGLGDTMHPPDTKWLDAFSTYQD